MLPVNEDDGEDQWREATDLERYDLMYLVGVFVVNAGVVEHRLWRGLLWAREDLAPLSQASKVTGMGWKNLLDGIEALAEQSEGGRVLTDLLAEHGARMLMNVRHTLIHGGMAGTGATGFTMTRFYRDGTSALVFVGRDDLLRLAERVAAFATALRDAIPYPYEPSKLKLPTFPEE